MHVSCLRRPTRSTKDAFPRKPKLMARAVGKEEQLAELPSSSKPEKKQKKAGKTTPLSAFFKPAQKEEEDGDSGRKPSPTHKKDTKKRRSEQRDKKDHSGSPGAETQKATVADSVEKKDSKRTQRKNKRKADEQEPKRKKSQRKDEEEVIDVSDDDDTVEFVAESRGSGPNTSISQRNPSEDSPANINTFFLPKDVAREHRRLLLQQKLREETLERSKRQAAIASQKSISPVFQLAATSSKKTSAEAVDEKEDDDSVLSSQYSSCELLLFPISNMSHCNAAFVSVPKNLSESLSFAANDSTFPEKLPTNDNDSILQDCSVKSVRGEMAVNVDVVTDDDDDEHEENEATREANEQSQTPQRSPFCCADSRPTIEKLCSSSEEIQLVKRFLLGDRYLPQVFPSLRRVMSLPPDIPFFFAPICRFQPSTSVNHRGLHQFSTLSPSTSSKRAEPQAPLVEVDALLLVGRSGTGKTVAISSAASSAGLRVIEENSASRRSGRLMAERVMEAVQSRAVGGFQSSQGASASQSISRTLSKNSFDEDDEAILPEKKKPNGSAMNQQLKEKKGSSKKKAPLLKAFLGEASNDTDSDFEETPTKRARSKRKRGENAQSKENSPSTVPFDEKKSSQRGTPEASSEDDLRSLPQSQSMPSEVIEGSSAQSCVVFEEVDTVFNDEAGFWSSIRKIVSKSKRPIVLLSDYVPPEIAEGAGGSDGSTAIFSLLSLAQNPTLTLPLSALSGSAEGIHGGKTSLMEAAFGGKEREREGPPSLGAIEITALSPSQKVTALQEAVTRAGGTLSSLDAAAALSLCNGDLRRCLSEAQLRYSKSNADLWLSTSLLRASSNPGVDTCLLSLARLYFGSKECLAETAEQTNEEAVESFVSVSSDLSEWTPAMNALAESATHLSLALLHLRIGRLISSLSMQEEKGEAESEKGNDTARRSRRTVPRFDIREAEEALKRKDDHWESRRIGALVSLLEQKDAKKVPRRARSGRIPFSTRSQSSRKSEEEQNRDDGEEQSPLSSRFHLDDDLEDIEEYTDDELESSDNAAKEVDSAAEDSAGRSGGSPESHDMCANIEATEKLTQEEEKDRETQLSDHEHEHSKTTAAISTGDGVSSRFADETEGAGRQWSYLSFISKDRRDHDDHDLLVLEELSSATECLSHTETWHEVSCRRQEVEIDEEEDKNDHLSRAAASMISTATASIEWIIGKQRTLRAISPTAKMERFELKSMPSCEFQRGLRRRRASWALCSSLLQPSTKAEGEALVTDVEPLVRTLMKWNSFKRTTKRAFQHSFARHVSSAVIEEAENELKNGWLNES